MNEKKLKDLLELNLVWTEVTPNSFQNKENDVIVSYNWNEYHCILNGKLVPSQYELIKKMYELANISAIVNGKIFDNSNDNLNKFIKQNK